jgi:hypothetical protein
MRNVRWWLPTTLALVLIAFYLGILAESARTTEIVLPDDVPATIAVTPTANHWRTAVATTSTDRFGDDGWLVPLAAVGALAGAAFLVARLAVLVARRVRA